MGGRIRCSSSLVNGPAGLTWKSDSGVPIIIPSTNCIRINIQTLVNRPFGKVIGKRRNDMSPITGGCTFIHVCNCFVNQFDGECGDQRINS